MNPPSYRAQRAQDAEAAQEIGAALRVTTELRTDLTGCNRALVLPVCKDATNSAHMSVSPERDADMPESFRSAALPVGAESAAFVGRVQRISSCRDA
jgi:hypothetical protein